MRSRNNSVVASAVLSMRMTLVFLVLTVMCASGFAEESIAGNEKNQTLAPQPELSAVLTSLSQANLSQMPNLITTLEKLGLESSDPDMHRIIMAIFQAQLAGNLYYRKNEKQLVVLRKLNSSYEVLDPLSQKVLAFETKGHLQKIRVNNRLRKNLNASLARMTLLSPDVGLRLQAVDQLMTHSTDENLSLLKRARSNETDSTVREKMNIALALAALDSTDFESKQQAIVTLAGSLEPLVKAKLEAKLAKNDQGHFVEPNKKLRAAMQQALTDIEFKRRVYAFIETLFFGLSLGSVLLLAAIGLSITFGVMGVINMAHGEMIMLGAYTTYVLQTLMPDAIGWALVLSIPAAFVVSALVGIGIERGIIRFLKGRPLETLLATFGLSLILQQAVRTVFSPLNRQVVSPQWMSGALHVNPVLSITYGRLYVIVFSFLIFALLLFIMKRTVLGLYVMAVSQNRDMAKAMGIRTEWVDAMTFGLGSGIAGMAGVALSQLTNVGPNLGQAYIIDSFMVVVFGGVGNLWGTLVGGLGLGVVNKFLEPMVGAVLAKILVLVAIILFIQKRPRGLFPQKGRVVE